MRWTIDSEVDFVKTSRKLFSNVYNVSIKNKATKLINLT